MLKDMVTLDLQPNERRCNSTKESHTFSLASCCPVSKNPGPGSVLTISYKPSDNVLEVAALKRYIDSYIGGRGAVRSMEAMIQSIAADCAEVLQVKVTVKAELFIYPGQEMVLKCSHKPRRRWLADQLKRFFTYSYNTPFTGW